MTEGLKILPNAIRINKHLLNVIQSDRRGDKGVSQSGKVAVNADRAGVSATGQRSHVS